RACLSADGGEHWGYDHEIILRDDAPSGDLGYPASVQLDDGTLLTVYYQQERPGEQTCLMMTRWRLGDE
ncbi:MAG: exo-alpha-sialidase, partial [Anaerolineales bacterium]